ncbi:hypothetical protein [Natronosalvus rutilus]|uniref:Uncharacterized protein n=1 Tax=Natronosalvus rutilus TaxID=2953753 RepID=A0A9E7NCX3_9EURY|nr:hypothetical protein [Natronosalvus rutilus]UTF55967.1 hypothetical protein NGM29_20970 [Natronosalvus rutilus]
MNGYDLADAISGHDAAELVDFTRDGYRRIIALAHTSRAKYRLIDLAEQAGFDVTVAGELDEETRAYRLTLMVPQKVREGGNRL